MTTPKLKPGNYMKTTSVIETLNHRFCRSTLASIANQICEKHKEGEEEFFNTKDLKNIMMPDLFKELETEVITRMI